jgi:hypothetical protein
VSGANQMPRALEVAIREAVGKRGVSVLVLPGDVALQPASDAPPAKVEGLLPPAPVVTPSRRDLERLAALLNGDGRVSILCGSGCQGAHDPPNGGSKGRVGNARVAGNQGPGAGRRAATDHWDQGAASAMRRAYRRPACLNLSARSR